MFYWELNHSWQEQYLTSELRSLVRYCSCHSNIKFISSRLRVISSISCACFFRIFIFTLLCTAATRTAKRQYGKLAKQKLHVHHACLYISLSAVVARLRARNFIILRFMQVNKGQQSYSSFPELRDSLFEFNSRKIRQRLTNWMRWNWTAAMKKFETARTHFLICARESFAYQQQYPYHGI